MKGEVIINLILVVFAVYFLKLASTFRGISKYDTIGPDFWPKLVLGLLLILTIILLIGNLRKIKVKESQGEKPNISVGKLIMALLCCFCYFFLMKYMGFILATLGFQLCFLLIQGVKKVKILVATPLVLTGILFVIFIKVMYLPLPRGIGIFREFSLLFY